jgi:hypothetical protein
MIRRLFGSAKRRREDEPDDAGEPDDIGRLLMEHGLAALDKQLHLNDLVGEADWLLDQAAGTITFGGEAVCGAQILGSESAADASWLWAWANPSIDERLARSAAALRRYGEEHAIVQLTTPELPLRGSVTGEAMALIASEVVAADAYYRGPHDTGAIFVLVELPGDAPRQVRGEVRRALRTLSVAPMALAVPLRRETVTGYLRGIGLIVEERGSGVVARDAAGSAVNVRFDRRGRLDVVSSTLRPG